MTKKQKYALNGICPYFTMFPLDFPYTILSHNAYAGEWVLDPFCGRGTTNYASRILGLPSIGIDSNPVAVALSQAKLANTTHQSIIDEAKSILDEISQPENIPAGEFWEWAFHKEVLPILCCLREGLLRNCQSDARKALRAIIMGALHGPQPRSRPAYFSNQCQRTYAPKPEYAVRFWHSRNLSPPQVDVLSIIEEKARRYYSQETSKAVGMVIQGDSREKDIYPNDCKIRWVITSPPYYGMRTYIPDQWLRAWFLGGNSQVNYSKEGQIEHSSPQTFSAQLRVVWQNAGFRCSPGAHLIVRFGAINSRNVDALALIKDSIKDSGWTITSIEPAGTASNGHRQALHFSSSSKRAIEEHDIWATWEGL